MAPPFSAIGAAAIIQKIQGPLGEKILSFWHFPPALIDVVRQWNDFSRSHSDNADYVDIIQAAILHSQHKPVETPEDWSEVPAIEKLGLDPAIQGFDETMQQQLDDARSSLMSI